MSELVTWLRAQLDEDERVAKEAVAEHSGEADWAIRDARLLWLNVMDSCDPASMPPGMADHIARHDPQRVFHEVAAKRRIIDLWLDTDNAHPGEPCTYSIDADPAGDAPEMVDWHGCERHVIAYRGRYSEDAVLRLLALPYAERDGYRQEWAPEPA